MKMNEKLHYITKRKSKLLLKKELMKLKQENPEKTKKISYCIARNFHSADYKIRTRKRNLSSNS